MKNCVVIGGGIIGLSTAYYLLKEGHKVTVIDMTPINEGASFVNAGYITPSHIISLASPGMMAKGIKWMFNSSSPFYMKPRLNADFLKWAWSFNKSATNSKVKKAIPIIKEINLFSRDLYQDIYNSGDLGDFQWERKGLLMLYKTDKAGEEELKVAELAKQEGLTVKPLTQPELAALEPNINSQVKGGIHYECDAHTTPNELMQKLKFYLAYNGVEFVQEKVTDFSIYNSKITSIKTNKKEYKADEFVLATGAWSKQLAKKLNINLLLEAGKGYRINVFKKTNIQYPAVLLEAKVAVTPMRGFTRFAGTMELSGINNTINKKRVEAIANAAQQYYKNITITKTEINDAQCGLRPVSPDGLPYIGKSNKCNNLTFATGHAMMGWSLGPATGKLISELISNKPLSINIDAFSPDRKFK